MKEEINRLGELYPHLPEKQLSEAAERIDHYLLLVLRIYERVQADPECYARLRSLIETGGTVCCTPQAPNL